MKTFKFFLAVALAVFFVACKGSGSMTPTSEKIQGPLGDYFEVVSKDYKAQNGKVSIEFKRVKDGFPAPWVEGMEVGYSGGKFEPTFSVEFQDGDGNVISKDVTSVIADEEEMKAIAALAVGETATITFDCMNEGVAQFKVNSDFLVNPESDYSSSSSSSSSSDDTFSSDDESSSDSETMSSSSSSEDWDAVLDSYDSYVSKYVSLAKKAANGDLDALAEYASFLEKAEELDRKLQNAKGNMSSSQVARYMKISAKMVEAATTMN